MTKVRLHLVGCSINYFLKLLIEMTQNYDIAYNQGDNCWGWYSYVGMGQYDFQKIRNQEVLRSVQYYHQHNLLREVEDIYIIEVDCMCTLYKLAEDSK